MVTSCTEVQQTNQCHGCCVVSGTFMPDVQDWVIVTVEQYFHKWPQELTALTMTKSSFHSMRRYDCAGDQLAWSHLPFQKAPHPSQPKASVYRFIVKLFVHWDSRIRDVPDQLGKKSSHYTRCNLASMRWWRWVSVVLRSISLCRNMWPAGITCMQRIIFHWARAADVWYIFPLAFMTNCISWANAYLQSSDVLADIAIVSITMPKNVILVVGRISFSVLIDALIWWQRDNIDSRFLGSRGATVKKSSK